MTPKCQLSKFIKIQKRLRNTANHNKHKRAQNNNKIIGNRRKICSHLKIK